MLQATVLTCSRLRSAALRPTLAGMPTGPDTPRVIAPPALIVLGCFAAGLALDAIAGFPGIALWWPLRWLLAVACLGAGGWLLREAARALRAAGTRLEPWRPATALVTTGIYGRSRNPIYLALAALQVGLGLLSDAVIATVAVIPALLAIRLGVIEPEESYLAATFGTRYRDYAARVRRWL